MRTSKFDVIEKFLLLVLPKNSFFSLANIANISKNVFIPPYTYISHTVKVSIVINMNLSQVYNSIF